MDQADFPGDTIGYINFASFLIGTPVIDPYYLKLAGPSIHNADHGPKRQVGVCRREGFGVEALAIGGFSSVAYRGAPTWDCRPQPHLHLPVVSSRQRAGGPF